MIPGVNRVFDPISSALGASTDEVKLITCFLLSFPLAGVLKNLPDERPQLKNIFTICVSTFYLVGLFDLWSGLLNLFISSAGAYLIAKFLTGPNMPWVGFVFLMGHMSVSHIYRHILNDPTVVDITGAQMVLVMKLCGFCWNVYDGQLSEDLLDDFQKEHRLTRLPSLLDYTAWVLFFPSLLAGPAFDFVEFKQYIETTMFDVAPGTDPAKLPKTRPKRKVPRSGTPAMVKLVTGLSWLIGFLQLSGFLYPEFLLEDRYAQFSFPRRVLTLYLIMIVVRMKYYAVWGLAEGACILSGIGFNGYNPQKGRIDWNRLQNVNPLGIELAQNSRAYLGNWNMNTNNWLRNYVYLRVTPRGKKPGFRASMATFVTSAFWHGFEPGYYMTFVLASLIQTVAKNSRRLLRPFFMSATDPSKPSPNKKYYDVFSWFVTQLTFAFTTTPFVLLGIKPSLTAWSRVYYYPIIGIAASFAILQTPVKAQLSKQSKKRQAAAQKRAADEIKTPLETPGRETKLRSDYFDALPRTHQDSIIRDIVLSTGVDESFHNGGAGPMGLPDDPEREVDDLLAEIRTELEMRRARGMSVASGLQEVVQDKVREIEAERRKFAEGVSGANVDARVMQAANDSKKSK